MTRGRLTVLIVAATFLQGAAQPTSAQRRSGGKAAVHSLRGVVHDLYTQQPLAGVTMLLMSFWPDCKFPEKQVKTDETGGFQFDEIPACAQSSSDLTMYATACERCPRQGPMTAAGAEVKPTFKHTDLGKVFVANDQWLTAHLGGACRGGQLPDLSMLSIKLPVLYQSTDAFSKARRWLSSFSVHGKWMTGNLVPWPALLCLDNQEKLVGEYVSKTGGAINAKAYAVTTHATLIRLSDQQRFTTTVSAEPPKTTPSYTVVGVWGDTKPAIVEWLKQIAAK